MPSAYCDVCGWSRRTGVTTTRVDLNRAMIDHHVETGHAPIEATDADPERTRPSPGDE